MAFDSESWLPAGTVIGNPVRTTGGSADSAPPLTIVNYEPIDAAIELTDDDKALALNVVTSAARDAINPRKGMILYNDTTGLFEGYDNNGEWTAIGGGGGSMTPVQVTSGPVQMEPNHIYYVDSLSQISLNLPSFSSLGDAIEVVAQNTGGWKITQNIFDLVQIFVGTNATTLGSGGSLESTAKGDTVYIESDGENWRATFVTGNLLGT